ncbi:MAG: hypothetical protein ACOCXZ_00765 [Chloroflexota bacterium]
MDLEKRIEALEQELDVLKNQIQATLLDIREQLLTHAHSALRANDLPPHQGAVPGVTNAAPVEEHPHHYEDEFPEAEGRAAVRKVARGSEDRTPIDWEAMHELEEWTARKIQELGPARTRQLIEVYAEKGRFSPHVADILVEFVMLTADSQRQKQKSRQNQARTRSTNAASTNAAPPAPAQRPNQQTWPANPTNYPAPGIDLGWLDGAQDDWSQPQGKQPQQRRTSAHKAARADSSETEPHRPGKPKKQPEQPVTVRAVDRAPAPEPEDFDSDDRHQNMVLRLIAGVSSAGIGMKRRRDDNG